MNRDMNRNGMDRLISQQVEIVGNLHIHSLHSDGAWPVPRIAREAGRLGLDFIGVTDHAHMTDRLHREAEGFYGKTLVLVGLEIGVERHHYLAFNIREKPDSSNLAPQECIDWVRSQGGFGFLAHPFEKGMPFSEHSVVYTWDDLSVSGYTGISIWNYSSRWKERIRTPIHGVAAILFKRLSLKGPSRKTLSFWDHVSRIRPVVAIGASDAHGAVFRWGPLRLRPLPYRFTLNSINVHLLLPCPLHAGLETARQQVYAALQRGSLFIAHDNLAPARGFRCRFDAFGGNSFGMGEQIPFSPGFLRVRAPGRKNRIRLIRNGRCIQQRTGNTMEVQIHSSGAYRVEVFRKVPFLGFRPWIFGNPIYLADSIS